MDRVEQNRRLIEFVASAECRIWRVDYPALSTEERVLLAIWELEGQANNGGLQQFFFNSSGCLAPHIGEALRTIGASRMAAILEQAIALVGRVEWSDDAQRRQAIETLSPATVTALHDLDRSFLAYPDDLTDLLYRYVCQHRDQVRARASAFCT
jgi:hypothetical protein